ncbi:hypothetical protein GP486_004065 [Trichoglossum hirsutum]|uniref:Ankyrin repeat protein n=1 Tax=Trichoglossum hirsutum TaxID=265104 RepID=A0A9P8LBI4_9PEZI|nr:hypothetical protein GP486_004065 [Trichoglossum hirsutum]
MDPSSFASAAASLLGMTIWVTGSLYGDWDYSSRVLAELLIYELSRLRSVLQSLEVTALSVTEAIIVPKYLLICLEDVKGSINNDRLVVYAARQGMVEIVWQLLYTRAEVIQTAFAAVENGHVEVLQLLLESGLPTDLISDAGQSLLEAAKEADHSAIVNLLQSFEPNDPPRVVYSVPSEDAVDPKTPSEKAILRDKNTASPSELPSGASLVPANEGLEQSTSKFGKGKKILFTKSTGEPLADSLRAVFHELQIKEIQSKPASPQTLSCSDPGFVRNAGPTNSAVPFFLLSEPISVDNLALGSIVTDPKDRLSALAPGDISALSWLVGDLRSESV